MVQACYIAFVQTDELELEKVCQYDERVFQVSCRAQAGRLPSRVLLLQYHDDWGPDVEMLCHTSSREGTVNQVCRPYHCVWRRDGIQVRCCTHWQRVAVCMYGKSTIKDLSASLGADTMQDIKPCLVGRC